MAPPPPSPPALLEATKNSTSVWQFNLGALFLQAKDRFPDVVWELGGPEDDKGKDVEEVWGHKAIVYARAPPSFQVRYFQFRPAPMGSPMPYSSSPTGTVSAQSSLSLSIGLGVSRSPSPFRAASPSPSTTPGTLLRLNSAINPTLFANELEYLYTGKGFGEAFEFLFDTSESRDEGDAEEKRIDKLRKDLVFMWRSRLYSDVRIALTGNFSSANTHQDTTAIFSSHRFILVSRSPYFHDALVSWDSSSKLGEPLTLNLPSPPFTPASLHFTLGFIYTGTLIFSHRTYDLDTAFHIMSSAAYLSIDSLYDEIQARIVQEMMHGLFHAFLEFPEYERITGGKWGTGGCRCRQCARRAPRVLEFAMASDVKNPHLERGARRALVGLFGEGWCTSEFANLPQRIKDSLLKGLAKRTTPENTFPLLFASQHAMNKLSSVIDAWAEASREMILAARKTIDDVLCSKSDECFDQPEWLEVMEADAVRFEDGERVQWVMDAVKRGLTEKNAPTLYQTLVSSILLRPHATDTEATLLPPTSHIRVQVEEVRMDVLRWIGKRWVGIRQECGFDPLEGWAIKEISGEIEVPVEDLFSPSPSHHKGQASRIGSKLIVNKLDAESDSISLRATVLRGNTGRRDVTPARDHSLMSSASSVRSVARSTYSRASTAAPSHKPQIPPGPRPDSKLTPSTITSSARSSTVESIIPPIPKTTISKLSPSITSVRRPATTKGDSSNADRSSLAPSVRSHASTIRNTGTAGPSILRPTPVVSRPNSTLSTTTDGSTTYKTANSERFSLVSRRTSGASTVSNVGAKPASASTPKINRPRRPSTSSVTSTLSSTAKAKRTQTLGGDPSKLTPPAMESRSSSGTSVRSRASSIVSSTGQKKVQLRKPASVEKPAPLSPATNGRPALGGAVSIKGKSRASALAASDGKSPRDSTGSTSTINGGLKRKGSGDTITKKNVAAAAAVAEKAPPLAGSLALCPRGATLDIGIPCIISSKRKRFKAFARYIGEVEGELGPWVGVEVPGDSWNGDRVEEERQWNDGTWGGIRYFEIGGGGSEWEFGDDRAARRRRIDGASGGGLGVKRAGEHLSVDRAKRFRSSSPTASDMSTSESRGLFVRPQQVLYVVDAVGADL